MTIYISNAQSTPSGPDLLCQACLSQGVRCVNYTQEENLQIPHEEAWTYNLLQRFLHAFLVWNIYKVWSNRIWAKNGWSYQAWILSCITLILILSVFPFIFSHRLNLKLICLVLWQPINKKSVVSSLYHFVLHWSEKRLASNLSRWSLSNLWI